MRVYILSAHDEYGAEMVRATLDPTKLTQFVLDEWVHERARMAEVLAQGELHWKRGAKLSNGWGGLQLHIVELDANKL